MINLGVDVGNFYVKLVLTVCKKELLPVNTSFVLNLYCYLNCLKAFPNMSVMSPAIMLSSER